MNSSISAPTGSAVGRSIRRLDGPEKVTGTATYSDDIHRPGMLFGALAFSPVAHARILGYRTEEALALPGVRAVITGDDFAHIRTGVFLKDEVPLAQKKILYLGEPFAAVAADSVEIARKAARLVELIYDELPAVFTPDAALAADAPVLHEDLGEYARIATSPFDKNMLWRPEMVEGDVDAAWADCDVVIEGEFTLPAQHHMYLEPCSAVAEMDATGRITIWSSTQSVFLTQLRVAEWLELPMSQIRAINVRVGGGFGGKGGPHVQQLCAKLAVMTGRAVKITLSRVEDFETVRCRHPGTIRMRTGAKRDGTLVARDVEILFDNGAYADESPAVLSFAVMMARGPYNIPNYRGSGRLVYTNKLKSSAFRGFGNPQASFAGESQIDELAVRLGLDPIDLRLKNAIRTGDRSAGGMVVGSSGFSRCLESVRDAVRSAMPSVMADADTAVGIGFSGFAHICGIQGTGAFIQMRTDGSLAVGTGAVDIGQGSDTALAQIAADALGVEMHRVSYANQDSDLSPYNWKTAASRTTYMTGRTVLAAANDMRAKIVATAAELLNKSESLVEIRPGGVVGLTDGSNRSLTFGEISAYAIYRKGGPITGGASLMYDGPPFDTSMTRISGFAIPRIGVFTFGAQAVEVEVDSKTGLTRVSRAWCASDAGRIINPVLAEGQVQGGFVQGMGYALCEEMIWDEDGRLINPTLMDYKVPSALDAPPLIQVDLIEELEPTGPFGAKGIGEPPLVGVAPAIANAIHAATGARPRALPMTPERVLDAMAQVLDDGTPR